MVGIRQRGHQDKTEPSTIRGLRPRWDVVESEIANHLPPRPHQCDLLAVVAQLRIVRELARNEATQISAITHLEGRPIAHHQHPPARIQGRDRTTAEIEFDTIHE